MFRRAVELFKTVLYAVAEETTLENGKVLKNDAIVIEVERRCKSS